MPLAEFLHSARGSATRHHTASFRNPCEGAETLARSGPRRASAPARGSATRHHTASLESLRGCRNLAVSLSLAEFLHLREGFCRPQHTASPEPCEGAETLAVSLPLAEFLHSARVRNPCHHTASPESLARVPGNLARQVCPRRVSALCEGFWQPATTPRAWNPLRGCRNPRKVSLPLAEFLHSARGSATRHHTARFREPLRGAETLARRHMVAAYTAGYSRKERSRTGG